MLYKSQLISHGSGSVGGFTASHNRFGSYIRNRTIPVNPNSVAQNQVRSILADLTEQWQNQLTPARRQAWSDYAANTPVTNRLGDSIRLTGLNHFVRSNSPRMQVGTLAKALDGPETMGLPGTFFPSTIQATADDQNILIGWIGAAEWSSESGAAAIVSMGLPQKQTINFFNGPWKYYGIIKGDTVAPPESPEVPTPTTSPYIFSTGQKIFLRVRVSRADGRLSNWFYASTTAIATAP